ncbi:MAG: 4Fe-4S dicluster domain-containing protein [Actinobacteria bacterium]|nr:MAG: 4Fe-4S dicluster domain-containing protein [Actinomycetota bacterium]
MARKRVDLTFPPEQVNKPITYHLVKDYDLVTNILRARVDEGEEGRLLVELTGAPEKIAEGISFLESQNVRVEEAARDISLDEEQCVDCGACTAVCKPAALRLEAGTAKLVFDKDKCVFCGACVKACPLRIIEVAF